MVAVFIDFVTQISKIPFKTDSQKVLGFVCIRPTQSLVTRTQWYVVQKFFISVIQRAPIYLSYQQEISNDCTETEK